MGPSAARRPPGRVPASSVGPCACTLRNHPSHAPRRPAAFETYSAIADAGFINGLGMTIATANNGEPIDSATLCTLAEVQADTCANPGVIYSSEGTVTVNFSLPPATMTAAFNGLTPSMFRINFCYSEPDQVNRKWRKFKNPFTVRRHVLFAVLIRVHASGGASPLPLAAQQHNNQASG